MLAWRRGEQTRAAFALVGGLLSGAGAARCTWVLDHGVSNAGRLRTLLLETAQAHTWSWQVEIVPDADARLVASEAVVASADREVLRRCGPWVSLALETIRACVPGAWVVDLT